MWRHLIQTKNAFEKEPSKTLIVRKWKNKFKRNKYRVHAFLHQRADLLILLITNEFYEWIEHYDVCKKILIEHLLSDSVWFLL